MNRRIRTGIILLVGVLAMSTASILVRWAQADNVPPIVIAAYRLMIATGVLTLPAVRQRVWKEYATLDIRKIGVLLFSGILLSLHFATWITSLAHTSVMSSVVLVTTTPLWIGLAAPLILGERTSRATWIAILVAIAGGVLVGIEGSARGRLVNWGDTLALMGAVFGAGYFLIGRRIREQISLIAYVWLVYGVAGSLLLGWTAASNLRLFGYSPTALIWLVALGLIPQLIGHSAANYAIRQVSATLVGVATLGEPIGSTILAIVLLHEVPGVLQFAGGLLVLAGIGIASLAQSKSALPASVQTRAGSDVPGAE